MYDARIDFVTVVYEAEYDMLQMQAASIACHLNNESIGNIFIINNSENVIPRDDVLSLKGLYKSFGNRVTIVEVSDLGIDLKLDGYLRQQLAKLLISKMIESDWYLVLDAKNHFISGRLEGAIFDENGIPYIAQYSYINHPLREKLKHVLSYMGVDHGDKLRLFTPTVTPIALYKSQTLDMIDAISSQSKRPFSDEFVRQNLTEFFLYGAWLCKNQTELKNIYHMTLDRLPNVWPKGVNSGGVERAINLADASQSPIFTIHRKALWHINDRSADVLAKFWVRKSLFPKLEDAMSFIDSHRARRPIRSRRAWAISLIRRIVIFLTK